MTKTYEPIAESLNEIINDLEKNDGKNLKRESLSIVAEYKSTKQSHHLIMNSLDNSGQFDTDDMIKAVFACFQ